MKWVTFAISMLKVFANLISIIFHPLYILTYAYGLLWIVNPFQFANYSKTELGIFFISLVMVSAVIPIVGVLMMRFLGMIDGLELKNRTDRIGPFIIIGVCYLWLTVNFINSNQVSDFLTTFMLGATISLFMGFIINIIEKISLHTIGMGGLLAGYLILIEHFGFGAASFVWNGTEYSIHLMLILLLLIFISGLVATSRLILGAHMPREVYGGLLVGLLGQVIAMRFIL